MYRDYAAGTSHVFLPDSAISSCLLTRCHRDRRGHSILFPIFESLRWRRSRSVSQHECSFSTRSAGKHRERTRMSGNETEINSQSSTTTQFNEKGTRMAVPHQSPHREQSNVPWLPSLALEEQDSRVQHLLLIPCS